VPDGMSPREAAAAAELARWGDRLWTLRSLHLMPRTLYPKP